MRNLRRGVATYACSEDALPSCQGVQFVSERVLFALHFHEFSGL